MFKNRAFSLIPCVLTLLMVFPSKAKASDVYAQLSSLVSQVSVSGSFSVLRFDTTDLLQNIEVSSTKEKIVIKESGMYLVMTGGQLGSTSTGSIGYIDFWYVKNGKPVPNSGVRGTIDPSNSTGVVMAQSVMLLKEGDELSVNYSSSGPNLGFIYLNPENEPAIPSVIFSIVKFGNPPPKVTETNKGSVEP